jgi:starvation-inducible DNA-binding protein
MNSSGLITRCVVPSRHGVLSLSSTWPAALSCTRGQPAPGSYAQFAALSSLADAPAKPPKAMEMVALLVKGHEAVARTARAAFPVANEANDQPTCDLLTQRMDIHEKTAWMLRSLLDE